ncbi:MAG: FAD-dependent oxidoreductase, partial [Gammaproteobacteria bacterium]|nr:FAD-dependent oxidoreductase [Gammaproteobacteria bacterium]
MDASVIVVGAGPVGLSLAINLGRAGVKTILLERNPEPQFL